MWQTRVHFIDQHIKTKGKILLKKKVIREVILLKEKCSEKIGEQIVSEKIVVLIPIYFIIPLDIDQNQEVIVRSYAFNFNLIIHKYFYVVIWGVSFDPGLGDTRLHKLSLCQKDTSY